MTKKVSKARKQVEKAISEVMHHEPSTVARAHVSEERKQQMRIAIGFAKARKAGARVPRKKKGRTRR